MPNRRVCGQKPSFNTQPPEGGWDISALAYCSLTVSTHSRPKAAGSSTELRRAARGMFQHTAARRRLDRLPASYRGEIEFQHTAARRRLGGGSFSGGAGSSFNTQPPEGGWVHAQRPNPRGHCFNTQPPEGGWFRAGLARSACEVFQHTAARRRLVLSGWGSSGVWYVSTHSRPKAAGSGLRHAG